MAILKELKQYYILKIKDKYNLDPVFSETLIELIEKKYGLTDFEQVLEDCPTYRDLYSHYFRFTKYPMKQEEVSTDAIIQQ